MKSFFTAILCLMLLVCSFVSCNRTKSPSESVAFDTLSLDTICPLFKNYPKPACHLSFNLSVPAPTVNQGTRDVIERFLCMMPKDGALVEQSVGQVSEMVRIYVKDYLMSYLSEGPNAIDNYGGDTLAAATWMSYEENVNGIVVYNANGFISYQIRTDSYTGGAHGNSSINNAVLSLHSGEAISLSDLFSDTSMSELNALIQQKLALQNNCQSIEELAEKGLFFAPAEIEATENFYFDAQGITWMFDPYDIAPYSMGEIRVSIDWSEALPLLDEESEVKPLAKLYSSPAAH